MGDVYLSDLLPGTGFHWANAPRITRSDRRDRLIVDAIRTFLGVGRPRRSQFLPIMGRIFEDLAATIDTIGGGLGRDAGAGGQDYEDLVSFLVRRRREAQQSNAFPYMRLAVLLPEDVWYVFFFSLLFTKRPSTLRFLKYLLITIFFVLFVQGRASRLHHSGARRLARQSL